MLFKRWITAIILIPFLLLILLKGNSLAFSLLIAVITIVSMKEYFTIVSSFDSFPVSSDPVSFENVLSNPSENGHQSRQPDQFSKNIAPNFSKNIAPDKVGCDSCSCHDIPMKIKICGYLVSLLIIFAAHKGSPEMVLFMTAFNIMVVFISILRDLPLESNCLESLAKQIQGIIYIPVFLSFLIFIRNSPNGEIWIIWLWLVIGASDTGAYYCGTYFGKRPLAPKISPNKTIEGSVGGLAAAVIVGSIFGLIYIPDISFVMMLLFTFIASAAGQMGDLFESALKRAGRIKDSGVILPGHGGLLDRIDGLIFAAPIAFIFKYCIAT